MKIIVDAMPVKSDGSAGGAVGFVIRLINGLANKENMKIIVLCRTESKYFLQTKLCNEIKLYTVKNYKIYKILFGLKIKGDILFCPFGAINLYNKNMITFSVILDIQHEFYPQFFNKEEVAHRKKFYKKIVKKANAVICISNFTKKTFCDKYNFPIGKAYTIYIPKPEYIIINQEVMSDFSLEKEKYILYPANFWEHKNHLKLLIAYKNFLKSKKCVCKLVLTGNNVDNLKIKEYVDENSLNDYIIITNYLDESKLAALIQNAKGLIFPSLFEGFGIPIVEGMAANKLIASSNTTSLPEIGVDEIFYFNPESIEEIEEGISYLMDSHMTKSIMDSYKEKLQFYNKDKIEEQYITLFNKLLNDKGKKYD